MQKNIQGHRGKPMPGTPAQGQSTSSAGPVTPAPRAGPTPSAPRAGPTPSASHAGPSTLAPGPSTPASRPASLHSSGAQSSLGVSTDSDWQSSYASSEGDNFYTCEENHLPKIIDERKLLQWTKNWMTLGENAQEAQVHRFSIRYVLLINAWTLYLSGYHGLAQIYTKANWPFFIAFIEYDDGYPTRENSLRNMWRKTRKFGVEVEHPGKGPEGSKEQVVEDPKGKGPQDPKNEGENPKEKAPEDQKKKGAKDAKGKRRILSWKKEKETAEDRAAKLAKYEEDQAKLVREKEEARLAQLREELRLAREEDEARLAQEKKDHAELIKIDADQDDWTEFFCTCASFLWDWIEWDLEKTPRPENIEGFRELVLTQLLKFKTKDAEERVWPTALINNRKRLDREAAQPQDNTPAEGFFHDSWSWSPRRSPPVSEHQPARSSDEDSNDTVPDFEPRRNG